MIHANIFGNDIMIKTNPKVFSSKRIDLGTLAMLKHVNIKESDKVLDLGCGCGVVGVAIAKVIGEEKIEMCDVCDHALMLSKMNMNLNGLEGCNLVKSDGLTNITSNGFTLILSNPPYHTDFSVAKRFIEGSFKALEVGGQLIMVTKRRKWYKNKLISVFGGVKIIAENGYFVFIAEKRSIRIHQGGVRKRKKN